MMMINGETLERNLLKIPTRLVVRESCTAV
jgi:DNA-binding LacI/PurR family transcriptional regulator